MDPAPVQLFHYHLVTSKVRLLEARYLGKLGFELLGRYGWRGEASEWFEAGISWEELDAMGFRLRLVELARGAVNVVLQPGHWEQPRVDHIGVALDEDGYTEALERAADLGLKIQDHPGKRTFIATEAGYRLEVHPPRDWIDELARRGATSCGSASSTCARRTRRRRRSRSPRSSGVDRLDPDVAVGDTLVRFLPGGPGGPARARRRGPAVSSYGEAGVSLAKAEEVVERLRAAVESTRTERVEGSLGAFAGLFALDDDRLLAATTDGVGTKLILSRRAGRLFDAGVDLAAHCVNDVAHDGRRAALLPRLRRRRPSSTWPRSPSSSQARPPSAARPAARSSAARPPSCRASTARASSTSPGRGRPRRAAPTSSTARAASRATSCSASPRAGLHANGFTLVRRLLGDDDFDPDLLLPPTRLYLDDVRRLREPLRRAGARARDRRRHPREPPARPARPASARASTRELGAAARLRLARRARRAGGRAAARLQPRHRLLRGRAGRGRRRARGFPVIGRLEEGVDGVAWADAP